MNPYNAAVLFWYARNSFYFELGLERNPDVLICKYEDLVVSHDRVVKKIYRDLNQKYPGIKIHNEVSSRSINNGQSVSLTPEIDKLAKGFLDRLNKVYESKNSR
ncbi:hypothetical protein KQH27_00440 [bacterium]|nr:hypothetical protein [bacterium]